MTIFQWFGLALLAFTVVYVARHRKPEDTRMSKAWLTEHAIDAQRERYRSSSDPRELDVIERSQ